MLGIATKWSWLEFSGIARIWKDFKDFAKKGLYDNQNIKWNALLAELAQTAIFKGTLVDKWLRNKSEPQITL